MNKNQLMQTASVAVMVAIVVVWVFSGNASKSQVPLINLTQDQGQNLEKPDVIIENVIIRHYDPQGQLQSQLTSPRTVHWPESAVTRINQPSLTANRGPEQNWLIEADQAETLDNTEQVLFAGNVTAVNRERELAIDTSRLTWDQVTQKLHSDQPIKIQSPRGELTATGFSFYLEQQRYQLHSQVTGSFKPPKPTEQ